MSITREALQSDAGMEFVFADLEVPREEFAVEPTPRARGLALRELTLHHTHDGVLGRFWHFVTQSKDKDEIFFVSTALDGSGMKPFVWPPDPSVADTAVIRLAAGQTHRWTLGEGAPVFPPQVIEGALATSIVVSDADSKIRRAGEIIGDIAKAVDVDGKGLVDKALALAGPGGLTAAAIATVIGKVAAVVGGVLKANQNDFVGVFVGMFTPDGSWSGKLSQNEDDASIVLTEV